MTRRRTRLGVIAAAAAVATALAPAPPTPRRAGVPRHAAHPRGERPDPALLTNNPNAANPMRLDRSEPLTCDQNHDYTAEQKAFDSDGWYDHQPSPIVNPSQSPQDALTAPGICGSTATPLAGFQDRCGYGPRTPLLVISPFAKRNFVDHTVTDQTSILRFIEDNWLSGQHIGDGSFDTLAGPLTSMLNFNDRGNGKFILDPSTGTRAEE